MPGGLVLDVNPGAGQKAAGLIEKETSALRCLTRRYKNAGIPMNAIQYRPIGIIHTPFKTPQGTPIQPPASKGVKADVEVFEKYAEGLADLTGFSHIYLIYHFHLSRKFSLKVKPFLDDASRGLFATRAPSRPNAIGLSIVELIGTEKNILHVKNIDVLDGTPLLDIKPYVPKFDICKVRKIGWMEKKIKTMAEARDDGRFAE